MPRKTLLRIGEAHQPASGEVCLMYVEAVRCQKDKVRVLLRHLRTDLEGIACEITREMPVSPKGLVVELLQACRVDVRPNATVDPGVAEGCVVNARFGATGQSECEIVSFEVVDKENSHDSNPE